jgi:DnaK suppressor protein
MNNLEVSNFKKQLEKMRVDLETLESSSNEAAATVVLDQTSVGRLSRMDAMQGQQMALEHERRRKETLQQIKAALQRIENGCFAYCLKCDEEIAMGRLRINPIATRCVKCSA